MMDICKTILFIAIFFLITISNAYAAFNEQLAISTKAISLGNAVTANPPGIMSIHYNPAGLSLLPPGKWFSQGLTIPYIVKTSKFDRNPDWPGIFGGFKDDPILDENGHAEGTNSNGKMFIPVINKTLKFLIAPTLGIAYKRPGSKWTFAFGNYAPFAVGLEHGDKDDPVRWQGKEVYQQHLVYAAPAVSYEITDNLSVGLAVGFGQTAMGAQVDMRNPNELVALTRILGNATKDLEIPVISELTLPPPWFGGGVGPYDRVATMKVELRDDFSPNYNIGVLWSPFKWLDLGICYQSPIKVHLRGKYIIEYSETWQKMMEWMGSSPLLLQTAGMLDLPIEGIPYQRGRLTTEIEFPQRIQAGVKLSLFDKLNLMFDVKWANWSVLKRDNFKFDQSIQLFRVAKMSGYVGGNYNLILNRNFEDTIDWSFGIEYKLNDKITLRAGYEWRDSPVRDNLFDLLYALPDMHFFGAGAGIKLPKQITLDIAAAYMVNKGYKVPDNSSRNLNSNVFTDVVYNPYAGLDYEQDTETYMISTTATMPFETMQELMHHQTETLKKIVGHIPFLKKKKKPQEVYIEKLEKLNSNATKQDVNGTARKNEKRLDTKQGHFIVKVPDVVLDPHKEVEKFILSWIDAWQKSDLDAFISFYAPYCIKDRFFGKDAIYDYYNKLWKKDKPKKIEIQNQEIKDIKRGYVVKFVQRYESQKGYKDVGIKTIIVEKINNSFQIINEQFQKIKEPSLILAQENIVSEDDIETFLSTWLYSWKNHELNKLISCYAPYAIKGKLFGKNAIFNYYKRLWSKSVPKRIIIGNVVTEKTLRGFNVSFIQMYKSNNGYMDIGKTTLSIAKTHEGLKIINQQWSEIRSGIAGLGKYFLEWVDSIGENNMEKLAKGYAPFAVRANVMGSNKIFESLKSEFSQGKIKSVDIGTLKITKGDRGYIISFQLSYVKNNKLEKRHIWQVWEKQKNSWKIVGEQYKDLSPL